MTENDTPKQAFSDPLPEEVVEITGTYLFKRYVLPVFVLSAVILAGMVATYLWLHL